MEKQVKYEDTVFSSRNDEAQRFLGNTDTTKKNSCVPKPPKPGEIIHCSYCGKPMYPKDFSTDKDIRKKEFKWQMHNACMIAMADMCDQKTPGLLKERKRMAKRHELSRKAANRRW